VRGLMKPDLFNYLTLRIWRPLRLK
jgi:hypothetical protein